MDYVSEIRESNARNNLFSILKMCRMDLDANFRTASFANASRVLGKGPKGIPVGDLLESASFRRYFDALQALSRGLPEWAAAAARKPWPRAPSAGLDAWHPVPPKGWRLTPGTATTLPLKPGEDFEEWYLVSPRERIGPDRDFRIEYAARAGEPCSDLSIVVGGPIQVAEGLPVVRPDHAGYTFVFGGMGNLATELQRCLLTIASNDAVRIAPGRRHQCVAERLGGVLRFEVDGAEVYRALDLLPLTDPGHGHVGLYACEPEHMFERVSIRTRPTCIPPKARRLIRKLRNAVLELPPDSPCRHVEAVYRGNSQFVFKDVTDVVTRPLPRRLP